MQVQLHNLQVYVDGVLHAYVYTEIMQYICTVLYVENSSGGGGAEVPSNMGASTEVKGF